jgi:DNA primase
MSWLDDLAAHAHQQLDERVRDALYGRGVSDEQIDLYNLGHLNGVIPALPAEAKDFVKWAQGEGRIDDVFTLPLTNALGQILGMQFRHVDQARKGYSEYVIEREEPVLFGLGQAMPAVWRTRRAFVVEGAFDVFPIQRGIPYVFATLTARVPNQLARFLRRLVKHVALGYDMDRTGRASCARFTKAYGDTFEVQTIAYPPARLADGKLAKDPSEIWEAWGDTRLLAFLKSTQESFDASNL